MSANWEVFSQDEKILMRKAIANHDVANLINVLESENITPEKEAEIQKILKEYGVEDLAKESAVRKEIETKFLSQPEENLTPEEEKKWQDKLDAEKASLSGDTPAIAEPFDINDDTETESDDGLEEEEKDDEILENNKE